MKTCRSPYIISYYGSYFKDSELWIVMEYCGGGSLSDVMRVLEKTLNEEQISTVVRDALKGLQYLHSVRKIHRDIKAGNILLNNKGEGKLADFGVSGQLSDTMAKRNTVIGTPFWMAPEVIQEVGYNEKADLWSLGITCLELAEGKPPYSNIHPMRAIFMIPSRPPPKLTEPEKWSKEFNEFVASCLIKDPDHRPTAEELLKHTFVVNAKPASVLVGLIEQANSIIAKVGREYLMEHSSEDESSGSTMQKAENGTNSRISRVGGEGGYSGTMVDNSNMGTMKETGNAPDSDYVAPFMAHIRDSKVKANTKGESN